MIPRITRSSTCGSLRIPSHLACEKCKNNIERCEIDGSEPINSKRCLKPWDAKWSNHREIGKVLNYNKLCEHLKLIITDEKDLINASTYTNLKSTYNEVQALCDPSRSPNFPPENTHPLINMTSPPTIPDDIPRSEPEFQSDSVPDIIRERGGERSKC